MAISRTIRWSCVLNDLPKHQNLRVGFDVYVLGSWDGNHQHQGGDQFRFSANGSSYLVDTSFSNHGGVAGDSDTTVSWQNPANPFDVEVTTTPGIVTEKDTETLFDYVVKHGAVDLSIADSNAITSQGYLDVTGDGFISPRDIISVFNLLTLLPRRRRIMRPKMNLFWVSHSRLDWTKRSNQFC